MSNDTEVGVFKALLSAFRQQVPERPERLPTFQEISGYPHYENVCSNILAFYLDPGKPQWARNAVSGGPRKGRQYQGS